MKLFSKISLKLYFKFILEKPGHFIVASAIATCPFLLETAGILSFIPLLQSHESGEVMIPSFWDEGQINLSTQEMILVLVALFSFQWVFSTAKVFLATSWSHKLVAHYKEDLFEKLQLKSPLDTLQQK